MSGYTSALPVWNAAGTAPNTTKQNDGWAVSEKPPADWFNWFFNTTFLALQELQGNAIHADGSKHFTGVINADNGLTMSGVAPILTFYESDQAVDEKDWWVVPDAKQFQIRAVNDAETTNVVAMNIIRGIGTAITSVNFPSGSLHSQHNTIDDGAGGASFTGHLSTKQTGDTMGFTTYRSINTNYQLRFNDDGAGNQQDATLASWAISPDVAASSNAVSFYARAPGAANTAWAQAFSVGSAGDVHGNSYNLDVNDSIKMQGTRMSVRASADTVMVEGKTTTRMTANAYYDGAAYQRFDATKPSILFGPNSTTGQTEFYGIAAGTGAITWPAAVATIDYMGNAAFTGKLLTLSAPTSTNQEERFHVYNGGGVAEWKFGQKSGASHDFILSKIVASSETDYFIVHAGDGTATFGSRGEFGTLTGSEVLDLKAGGSNDHVYMGFYARSATQGVRSGYMGYPANGTTTLTINNELGAPIELISTTVLVNALKGRQSILQIDSGGGDLQIGSPGGNVGITDGTHSAWKFSYNTALDHLEANVPITFDSLATFNQGITNPGGNVELGSQTSVQTPFIDFHSSGSGNDYDARIIASGGAAGAPSTGTLNMIGGAIQANGNTILHVGNVASSLNQSGYIKTPSSAGTRIEQTLFWQATSQTFNANTSYSFTANLPITFPTAIQIVVGSISGGWVNNGYNSVVVRRLSNSQVQITLLFGVTWTGAPSVEVIAIGY